jgi:hypothetical protein
VAYLRHFGEGVFTCNVGLYYGTGWPSGTDGLVCLWCWLPNDSPTSSPVFTSTEACVAHLQEHVAAGHVIPDLDGTIAELWADDAENFPP